MDPIACSRVAAGNGHSPVSRFPCTGEGTKVQWQSHAARPMVSSLADERGNALMRYRQHWLVCLCAGLLFACPPDLGAQNPAPQDSKDGLILKSKTKQRVVYMRPGANFSRYDRVALLDCFVEFQKDWQTNYNQNVVDPNNMVTDQDVQQMKAWLSAEFRRVFTTELQKGGYKVVDFGAPDVLILRPALTNVQVTAPDVMSAGIEATVIRSAGSATLYLELWNSDPRKLLARVVDAEADQQPFAQQGNSVTNAAAAEFIMKNWADDLVRHLDAARKTTSG